MLPNLAEDVRHLARVKGCSPGRALLDGVLLENGFQAVLLYRLAHWLRRGGVPLAGPLLTRIATFLTGAEISASAEIGPGLYVSHGVGLVVGGGTRIGARATLLHGVTLGSPSRRRLEEMPILGDDVFVGAGAAVIGAIRVGDGARIGALTLVSRDLPAGARVTAPAPVVIAEASPGDGRGAAKPR